MACSCTNQGYNSRWTHRVWLSACWGHYHTHTCVCRDWTFWVSLGYILFSNDEHWRLQPLLRHLNMPGCSVRVRCGPMWSQHCSFAWDQSTELLGSCNRAAKIVLNTCGLPQPWPWTCKALSCCTIPLGLISGNLIDFSKCKETFIYN